MAKANTIKASLGERIFYVSNYFFFFLLGIATLFPFLNVLAKSFSSEAAVISGLVTVFPIDFQTGTYELVLGNKQFMNSFKVTVLITVSYTFLALVMTAMAAYPLSKPGLRWRKPILLLYVFAMLFNGGLIPNYLLMQNLNLINSLWSLILPGMVQVFYMLLIKNFFEGLPEGLEESAKLDGASNMRILWSLVLPLSLPVLATVALFYAVLMWNSYFSAMVYISRPELKPMQLYLKELIASTNDVLGQSGMIDISRDLNRSPEAVQAASIIVATVPILCVYPFLQKYFVKGVLVGSVKG
ncbi:carbohydrate ABC transporter permease [Paenibacillus sp. GD4]|uniref:carbohydrate ABC transporter permease n=1 Tax=Paenibacillus sp. GD4 TaxID=3068890 RepID=UPI002796B99B|nr:carbohydrate ABC transporter permease [Paenibacillus sp. GD4]MDQ1910279.1 carbohydrate ABC transporter permease [Paenibacillus sp. GD4]